MSEAPNSASSTMDLTESSQDLTATNQGLLASSKPQEIDSNTASKFVSQNATNSHPLMREHSPMSPDFPDLIPEKPKRVVYEKQGSFASCLDELDLDVALKDYKESLPDFPESPSALKKSPLFDLPLEAPHGDTSDPENDKSVYEARLSWNFQNVSLTLNDKEGNLNFLAHNKRSNKLRRVKVLHTEPSEDSDVSSLDSVSESLKSDMVFADEDQNGDLQEENSTEPIEPLSAEDERRHARHWQRMVLPEGEQRTIDMRVIEPYKRVLSHGGYLRAGGHTAIVLFSACFLPDKSRVDYVYVMDNLFLYVLWTLERLVTDDYVLVYLHGGATKLPSFGWLKRCYQMVGRKLRKNLTHLYLVHPTLWIKTMLFMAKPFISSKFYRKISYVSSLKELLERVPLEIAAIPDKVKVFDSLQMGND